ncbi:MAG: metal ABC transporter permease, partial [Spirochaetia bacterium]|nr:metal ABC transporter permease [Spirochaetia bacterium]
PVWDFFFYASFGVVVTSSVEIGGIFLVFSLLIAPSVIALLFARRIVTRLFLGWTVGVGVSAAGLASSYRYDLPTGAAIVCAFGGAAILAGLLKWFSGRKNRT